ncbi:phage tail protein [Faucicola atlantae]|uniref:Uncharacterized protein n=1 Tax=Faucicola atlantae TaxID=34059 RepID=A0A1B8QCU5_9GAMM|nr:phage tail protein [Moraxella atlantae]OBX79135.1 hypothetical protein A9306_08985 [Moraxella atlantae]
MANYYVLLTDYGKSVLAEAHTTQPIKLTEVVLGDANNKPYLPESRQNQSQLINETARVPVTQIKVVNDNTAEVTAIVPSDVGGFNVHEIGITDASGKLVYIGNFHGGYRPLLSEGAGGDMEMIFTIAAANLAKVIITADPAAVVASKTWVNHRFSLLFAALFPMGYKYWSHSPDNPKPLFDALFGYETFWRRLEGVQLLAVQDDDSYINQPMQLLGQRGLTDAAINSRPQSFPLYTSYLFERYDPASVIETVWRVTATKDLLLEGEAIQFIITANNVADGQILPWTISEDDDQQKNGTVIMMNGQAIIDYQSQADDNQANPDKQIRLKVGSPANLDLIIPLIDSGHHETILHITQSTYEGIVLDEWYRQQTGQYPAANDTVRFIIDSGVTIVAPNTVKAAIESGTNWADGTQIIIENHGRILGRGGDGGRSAYVYNVTLTQPNPYTLVPAQNGQDGGTAIVATKSMTINNYSLIAGGGGGGGGQGFFDPSGGYNLLGGGGTGGGAPFGQASLNESTYSMYNIDPTVTTKCELPRNQTLYAAFFVQSRNFAWKYLEFDADSVTGSASDAQSARQITIEITPDGKAYKTDFATDRSYAVGIYANGGNGRTASFLANMSTSATLEKAGLGGSNVTASPAASAYILMNHNDKNITTNKGGDGGAYGENGQDGNLSEYFGLNPAASGVVNSPSAKGGLAGYIYQGNVSLNNFNGGIAKGRTL